jgi:4'-phosphopantetheinyl transferase EntD
VIARLLPSVVVSVEAFADDLAEKPFPGEEGVIAHAVPSRRSEFVTARRCAREALAMLGQPPAALLPGERRSPRWPDGFVGSITHCAGYRAAAAARAGDLASVGIDAEPHAGLPEGVEAAVTRDDEPGHLRRLAREDPSIHWDRVLFCAKEAIYKAWFPLTGRWLGFEEARLTIDPAARTFTGRLLVDGSRRDGGPALETLDGRFSVEQHLIRAAVTVAA